MAVTVNSITGALPAGTNNIGDVDVLTLPNVTLAAGTNTNEVVGDVAHDAVAAGNPLLVGGYASAAAPTDVSADGDAVRAWRLRNGAAACVITAAGALVGGDAANGLDVDVTRVSGSVTVVNAGTFAVQAAQSGTWTVQPGNTANTTPWLATDTPATSGGLSASKTISAASTNATSVKGSAGQVYSIACSNVNAAARYLKLYNKATAPTVGSDTPVLTLVIPGNTAGAGFVFNVDKGIAFGTGIAFALTTGIADADTGAVSANEHAVNILYK